MKPLHDVPKGMTSEEEYNNLIGRSERFLLSAERNLQDDYIDVGAFSVNQSLELYLKALLLKNAGDFPHTHDLKVLLHNLASVLTEVSKDKVERLISEKSLILSMIQDAYITSRYFFTSLTSEDLDKLISEVREIQEGLSDVC